MATLRNGNIRMAMTTLGNAKGRSFLTMLGIIIGVAAVIVIISVGQGVTNQVQHQSARYGRGALAVRPVTPGGASLTSGSFMSAVTTSLSSSDIDSISHTSGVAAVVPLGVVTGSVEADTKITTPLVVATSTDFTNIIKNKIAYGGFFDAEPGSRTAVLGSSIAQKLFEDSVPLGQTFTFRGERFMVAGIFSPFVASPFSLESDLNNAIFIPYTSAKEIVKADPATYQVLVRGSDAVDVSQLSVALHDQLVAAHGGADDITVQPLADKASGQSAMLHLLTIMTFVTAIIALVVGGIGIMNVMLVSVTERTQEVGLRKAIGATNRQILRQFMTEALMLSIIGAFVGVLLALATVGLMRLFTTLQPVVVWQACLLVPLVAVLTGVVFGTFPAAKAAMKDPIDALRRL